MSEISSNITLFIVEDDPEFASEVKMELEKHNYNGSDMDIHHFLTGDACLEKIGQNPDVILLDLTLPGMTGLELLEEIKKTNQNIKTIVMSGQDSVDMVVKVYNAGAEEYFVKNENALDQIVASVTRLTTTLCSLQKDDLLQEIVVDREKYADILGESAGILRVLRMMQRVEKSAISVLITGESGTGKELVAKAIHKNSPRKNKTYIPINVPAIPEDLIESELFGHEKGAFTGAINKRIGKFEEAHQGAIFLDEIGEMDLDLQSKLLRVLQEGEVVRVGSNKIIKVDVRVISSTNKNLELEVREGRFREDLYYRLNGFMINLPALKDRNDDAILLAKHYLEYFCKKNKLGEITLTDEAVERLRNYTWPGNIRQLISVIERASLLTYTSKISAREIVL